MPALRRASGPCCVIVADRMRARFFLVVPEEDGARRLVEQDAFVNAQYAGETERNTDRGSGPVHPHFEQRAHHRLALEQRFAKALAARAAKLVQAREEGEVMLVAPAHMLGQLREIVRRTLPPGFALTELAREYTHLTASELARELGYGRKRPAAH